MARTDSHEQHASRRRAALQELERHAKVHRGELLGIADLRGKVKGLSRDAALAARAAYKQGERADAGEPEPVPVEGKVVRKSHYRPGAKRAPPKSDLEPATGGNPPKSDPPPAPPAAPEPERQQEKKPPRSDDVVEVWLA